MASAFLFYVAPARAQSNGFFDGPHTDFGVDADANNRYEFLQVNVTVNVTAGGDFTVEGLLNKTGTPFITNTTESLTGGVGEHIVSLFFNGTDIFESDVDGPYEVHLTLLNDTSVVTDTDTHVTAAYNHLDFGPVIAFTPPHSDWGIDTDANSLYNFIQVNVSANTSLPGIYMIFSMMASSQVIDMKIKVFNLTAGDHIIQLNFSGVGAFVSGDNGPYTVMLMASGLIFGGPPSFADTDMHMTKGYFFTDFETAMKRTLTGQVIDETTSQGVNNETIWLANKTHQWLVQLETNETGFFNFTAFEADFVLTADSDDLQGRTVPITVSGDTNVNINLTTSPADENFLTLAFLDWGNVSMNMQGFMHNDNQTQRFMIDQFVGDGDLVVEPNEVDIWLEIFMGAMPSMNDTTGMFEVDGIAFQLNGTLQFDVDMTGDVLAAEPVLMNQSGNYTSKDPIPQNSTHQVMMNVSYEGPNGTEVDTIILPTAWILESYQAAVNITVSGLNNNTVIIDPLPRPVGEPEMVDVFLNATMDSTPPQISDAWATPDPQEVPQDVTIGADITENSGVASVKVNVTDPTGATIGNFTMAGGSTYTHTRSYTQLGLHNFTVWVEDDAGLFDSFDGSFSVQDTTAPSLGDPEAVPSLQEAGQTVDFSVTVTDNHQLDEVKISIKDPDDALVGNFTMTLSAGNYTYSRVFTKLGTYDFTVWASDITGNLGSKSGQFTIQDTTPPQITDAAGSPDPQEVFGKVNITATIAENSGITSVHVNITDPDGGTVGNFTMASGGGGMFYYEVAYDTVGTFSFTIWVEDDAGQIDSWADSFAIRDTTLPSLSSPSVGPTPQEVGQNVDFSVQVTDNYQLEGVTIEIRDADDVLLGSFAMTLVDSNYTYSASYDELGTYSYTITAEDSSGNTATRSGEFTIHDTVSPEAATLEPFTVHVGEDATFDGGESTDNHRIVNYTWDLGDGTTAYGATAIHTYAEVGSYTVTLTVRDEAGNEATHSFTVTVTPAPPAGPSISDVALYGGIGAVIAGVAAAAALLWRRSKRPPGAPPREPTQPKEQSPPPPEEEPAETDEAIDELLNWEEL